MHFQNLYSLIARFYNLGLRLNGYKGAAAHIIKKLPFEINASFRVLDAGSGTGLYSFAVLDHFPNAKIAAFDLNNAMVAEMRRMLTKTDPHSRVKLFIADILQELPAEAGNFDLIITGGVLEYTNMEQAIANLSKHLPRGGYFLNSPVKNNIWGRLVGKLMGFTPYADGANVAAFTKNGFELIERIKIPWQYFPISLVKEALLFQKK
ncbi:MAG: class I SAM-dependent methyltransferase [Parcubacteria group bacterium]|nr:class I SAM-dependent methyltransferase [Parcubacteria group bacterium]